MEQTKKYFYGYEISTYGIENNRVDYRTLSQTFNHVLNNNIIEELQARGFYFDKISGGIDNSELIEELEQKMEELEEMEINSDIEKQLEELEEQIEELKEEEENEPDVFQFYIVDDIRFLEMNNEIVFYNEELDIYIWSVTHYGTSWDHVLTDIKISDL